MSFLHVELMPTPPSTVSGADRVFPPTAWTLVMQARETASLDAVRAREDFCKAYWKPVAKFLHVMGLSEQDAQEGAQDILSQLLSGDALNHIDPSRGKLRHYLKSAARHHAINIKRDASARKRGGGMPTLILDELAEADQGVQPSASDHAFDRAWAAVLCDRAMEALAASYARRGKTALFEALKPSLFLQEVLQRQAEISAMFGVTEAQIRIETHRLRRRLAGLLRSEVAATLGPHATPAEVEDETRYLVRTLAHEH